MNNYPFTFPTEQGPLKHFSHLIITFLQESQTEREPSFISFYVKMLCLIT